MNPKDTERVLDEISQQHVRPDLNLLPGVIAAIKKRKQTLISTRKLIFAVLFVLVVVTASFFTFPGVARAVRSLFGYIPGVGKVEQGVSLRTLTAPVIASQDGYTLSVENAVLDSTRTVITYRVVGEFPEWDDPTLRPEMCRDLPELRLPDRTHLVYSGGEGSSNGEKSTWKLAFGAVPGNINQATLVLPCLPELPAGEGPHNWVLELEFEPAQEELTVFPVVDQPTLTPSGENETGDPQSSPAVTPHGITWNLDGIAVLPDGAYLETTLSWPGGLNGYEVELFPNALRLTDAAGQEAAVWQTSDMASFAPAEQLSIPLTLQTGVISNPGPALLILDYLGISRGANTSFTFDVGSTPQPGQIWPINQELSLDGHNLRVISAKYVETPMGAPVMMLVELESDSGIMAVMATDLEHETLDSGGSPSWQGKPIQAGWHYRGAFPQGMITVTISMITERLDGPWIIEWTPPSDMVIPEPELPPALPTLRPDLGLCQTDLLQQTATSELPAGLDGLVAYTQWNGERGEVFVSNLDGSNVIALGPGAFPDLSPDGQRVVFRGADEGTYVRELSSGKTILLPESLHPNVYDNWPMWSPDGSQIAFYRVSGNHDFDLFVMDADGGNLHAVTSGPEFETLVGWTMDGTGLYYITVGPEGQFVRLLDLQTGQSREISRLPERTITARLSPDGTRLLYLNEQAIWLDRMDGSPVEVLLATNGIFANQIHATWSPDGHWLTINYLTNPEDTQPKIALLEVDGCRLVYLTSHPGSWISDWVK